ncbi:phage holin family protein [Candidatus Methylobacter oryzae]|uniref:Phage holin family protein n=1 Tax=Candidatus Methylobacter oryzae TaxID=2497749 RepID=A0ABY3CCX2_9GAMM|nr:phage holin family protein [Candidatus Methylobacter oryzae]TRW98939.1 phage holin family protein [Candidatus Methylobacter oryzae]
MERSAVNNETLGQAATEADPVKTAGILDNAQALWRELYGFGHDYFHLIALEARRAGRNLVFMIIAGVMAAVLLIGAWGGLIAAAVMWMIEHGFVASSAILLSVLFNLLLTLVLVAVIHRKSRYLQFPATVHSLRAMPPPVRDNKEES